MNISDDLQGMTLALEWAAKGLFLTAPNPRVGCILVKDGSLLGAGHTQPAGQAHAEIQALQQARTRGLDVGGATAYVTLEPCSHHGRTPPCVEALIQARIARVVIAVADPNPLVAGQGVARLRSAGITANVGLMAKEAQELNIGFFSRMQRGLPWVRMKVAASLDGKTALHDGQSQWITGTPARDDGHWWRARACAVLTGIGTVREDDPQMNVRAVATPRQPLRIVVDSRLEIHPDARILQEPGCLVVAAQANPEKEAILRQLGAEVLLLPNAQGKVDLPGLMQELARRELNELHVEAGSKLNGSLVREGCVDELLLYVAPCLLGEGQGMFNLAPLARLQDKRMLRFHECKEVGDDLRLLARFT